MKTKRNAKPTTDNRPSKESVECAWSAYDTAMKTGAPTYKCQELHRAWKVLHAERHGV